MFGSKKGFKSFNQSDDDFTFSANQLENPAPIMGLLHSIFPALATDRAVFRFASQLVHRANELTQKFIMPEVYIYGNGVANNFANISFVRKLFLDCCLGCDDFNYATKRVEMQEKNSNATKSR